MKTENNSVRLIRERRQPPQALSQRNLRSTFMVRPMLKAPGCLVSQISIGGKWYDRIPCGDEMDFDPCMSEGERCHDCGATRGHYHHWNCDAERCPACHGQLLSCDCVDVYVENKHI